MDAVVDKGTYAALLERSAVVMLDEETANCDHATDATIQSLIRTRFAASHHRAGGLEARSPSSVYLRVCGWSRPRSASIFATTYATAAVGLTLTAASRVYLLESSIDPAQEAQAATVVERDEASVRALAAEKAPVAASDSPHASEGVATLQAQAVEALSPGQAAAATLGAAAQSVLCFSHTRFHMRAVLFETLSRIIASTPVAAARYVTSRLGTGGASYGSISGCDIYSLSRQ